MVLSGRIILLLFEALIKSFFIAGLQGAKLTVKKGGPMLARILCE